MNIFPNFKSTFLKLEITILIRLRLRTLKKSHCEFILSTEFLSILYDLRTQIFLSSSVYVPVIFTKHKRGSRETNLH